MQTDRDSLMNAGAQALSEGRFERAEGFYAKAAGLYPRDLDAKLMLGITAARIGKSEVAIPSLREVLEEEPENLEALGALSHFLRVKGELQEATELAERAMRLNPTDAATQHNLGRCYLATGDLPEASAHLTRALKNNPNVAAIHCDLGIAFERQGRIQEAIAYLEQSIKLEPNSPQGYALLAHLFLNYGNLAAASQLLRRAHQLEPNSARGLTLLALAMTEDGQFEEAENAARSALAVSPKSADAMHLLGRILQHQGRFEEAEECLRAAIDLAPAKIGPYYRLANGKKITEADRDLVAKIESFRKRPDVGDTERALIEYALGKSYDDLGQYEEAMAHFDEANRVELDRFQSAGRIYDPKAHAEDVDKTIQAYTSELFERAAGLGSNSEQPVFIVGMERSGTSLVEQILSSHPDVAGAGELPFWPEAAQMFQGQIIQALNSESQAMPTGVPPFSDIAAEYLKILGQYGEGKPRVTDKLPGNIAMLGLIHLALPNARVIWCLRQPVDNCLSIYFTPFRAGSAYLNSRRNIVSAYKQQLRLLEHWQSVLPPSTLHVIQYEELVQEKERPIRAMIDFLGLEWNDACLHPELNARGIKTPSLWQARQPVHAGSVDRWRNYEPWLGEFKELL